MKYAIEFDSNLTLDELAIEMWHRCYWHDEMENFCKCPCPEHCPFGEYYHCEPTVEDWKKCLRVIE